MTPGKRVRQIMRQERERTADLVAALDAGLAEDVMGLFMALQGAVNQYVGACDRTLDRRVLTTALDLARDEAGRIARQLDAAGLTPE